MADRPERMKERSGRKRGSASDYPHPLSPSFILSYSWPIDRSRAQVGGLHSALRLHRQGASTRSPCVAYPLPRSFSTPQGSTGHSQCSRVLRMVCRTTRIEFATSPPCICAISIARSLSVTTRVRHRAAFIDFMTSLRAEGAFDTSKSLAVSRGSEVAGYLVRINLLLCVTRSR
jgi:hypothetical protein